MVAPAIAEAPSDDGPTIETDEEAEPAEPAEPAVLEAEVGPEPSDEDPEIAEVDLTDDDIGGGGLFSGDEEPVETGGESTDSSDSSESDGSDEGDGVDPLGDPPADAIETAINEGAARLAVIGIDDEEKKDDLETEFAEVFEMFQLGRFGGRAIDEYVFVDDNEPINPLWGLAGTALACAAFAIWMRPDTDEQLGKMSDTLGDALDGVKGVVA